MTRLCLSIAFMACLFKQNMANNGSALPRGIDIKNRHLYANQDGYFQCLKSGEKIPFSELNDDYCDCLDGSDEPGTAACAHLSNKPDTFTGFWCRNAGHIPETISATLVDDGICDCCDGSDEVNSGAKCTNICQQVGAVEREKRRQEFEAANKGYEVRVEMAKKGQEEYDVAVNELKELENEVNALNAQKDQANKIRDELQAAEKVEKDRCIAIENERKEAEKQRQILLMQDKVFSVLDVDKNGEISANDLMNFKILNPGASAEVEAMANSEPGMNLEELPEFSIELAETLIDFPLTKEKFFENSQDEDSENPGHQSTWDLISSFFDEKGDWKAKYLPKPVENSIVEELSDEEMQREINEAAGDEVDNNAPNFDNEDFDDDDEDFSNYHDDDEDYNDSFDDYHGDEDDDGDFDHHRYNNNNKNNNNNNNNSGYTMEIFDDIATLAIEKAKEARETSSDLDRKYREKSRELEDKKGKHAIDFGQDKSFSSLHNQCIEFRTNEYIYEVCLFKSASQKQLNGGGNTNLGKWQNDNSWIGQNYDEQKYFNGLKCWNGPDRSAVVKFSCGVETKVIEVSEPQRCEYLFEVETPAVCEKMEDPFLHDEL